MCSTALTYAGNKQNLVDVVDAARLSFQHGDIRDPKAVAQAMEGVTHVVNFAPSRWSTARSTTRARSS
jgi:dTDP-D-glucose 4,6-dehydratase